jgi:DNA-binding response OmpR family regulator
MTTMSQDEKILIVEDNPVIAQAIEAAGHGLRFVCHHANDGWDAIEKLETEEYAAIIIDADVAHHSGYGVLTYLREENGEHLDNVILMTSSDRDEVSRRVGGGHLTVCDKADAVAAITRVVGRA